MTTEELLKFHKEDVPVPTFEGRVSTLSYQEQATAIEGNCTVVRNYLQAAGALLKGRKSKFGRAQPLMALPLPGCGEMDETDLIVNEGLMISTLLPLLYEAANTYKVDVAVCTTDRSAFGVCQVLRAKYCPFKGGPYWMLTMEQKMQAARIQKKAKAGKLALLYGAGISMASGLPSWGGLLAQLAEQARPSGAQGAVCNV